MERVNHPSYYNSGIECIELLDALTEGYEGIVAFDIGQSKYLYRCGAKPEKGLTPFEKAIEDIDKNIFYIKDIMKREEEDEEIIFCSINKPKCLSKLIAKEFCINKPEAIHQYIKDYIFALMTPIFLDGKQIVEFNGEEAVRNLQKIRSYYETQLHNLRSSKGNENKPLL